MKTLKPAVSLILFLVVSTVAISQNPVLKVWPMGVPGSLKSDIWTEKVTEANGSPSRYEKVTDPTLTVFLPTAEKATGTAVLICPGGGYGVLAFDHEGFAIARWLNENGIAAYILKYRLPSDQIMKDKSVGPLQDAQEAIRIIRRNREHYKINPNKIGVIGFSAGGHLASTLSTHYAEKVYETTDTVSARPDFSLLIYPVITFDASFTHAGSRKNLIGDNPSQAAIDHFSNELQINAKTPPAFLVHSSDDKTVPVKNSLAYYENLVKNNVIAEMHIFQKGGHGYGMSVGRGTQASWPELCIKWLNTNGF
ncbi:MAG: alpha/beta hydrolase [Bacteroidales bacterium]|nr:alpha/beta hydrolase [Bacteroidales bacterium]